MTIRQRLATLIATVSLALVGLLFQASVIQSAVAKMTKDMANNNFPDGLRRSILALA